MTDLLTHWQSGPHSLSLAELGYSSYERHTGKKTAGAAATIMLMAAMMLPAQAASAETVTQDGITYTVMPKETTTDAKCVESASAFATTNGLSSSEQASLQSECTSTIYYAEGAAKDEPTIGGTIGGPGTTGVGTYSTTAAAGTVRSKPWTQWKVTGSYKTVHTGRFYYDGQKVWSTESYRGKQGFHSCNAAGSWNVVQFEVTGCTHVQAGSSITDKQTYRPSLGIGKFAWGYVKSMHIVAYPNGVGKSFGN